MGRPRPLSRRQADPLAVIGASPNLQGWCCHMPTCREVLWTPA